MFALALSPFSAVRFDVPLECGFALKEPNNNSVGVKQNREVSPRQRRPTRFRQSCNFAIASSI